TTITDPLGKVTTSAYDASGRLTQTVDARGTVTKVSYDAVNRVVTRQVDPTGLNLTTTYLFDAFSQVYRVFEGSRSTSYKHDAEGRLTQVIVDPSGLALSTAYNYDGLGDTIRVDRKVGGTSNEVTQYVFDKLGRRVKEIDASTL